MSTQEHVGAPSAADLAWGADRLSLDVLDADQRTLLEQVAEWLAEHWPVDEIPADVVDQEEHAETERQRHAYEAMLREIAETIGLAGAESLATAPSVKAALERERGEGIKDATVPSRAGAAQVKALRLLVEGRLSVKRIETGGQYAGLVVAECHSESGDVYLLGYDPRDSRWRCTCAELQGKCSHLVALKQIVPPRG